MKKTLLSISAILGLSVAAMAQTYTPAAGTPLANGELGTAYAQTINAAIPTTVNVTGQTILNLLPSSVSAIAGGVISPTTSYPVTVTSTTLSVVGAPAGVTENCGGCVVSGGASRDIVFGGTPTATGNYVIDITSATVGSTTIQSFTIPFGGQFSVPIVGNVDIPALPNVLDAEGYTMSVSSTGIKEANAAFSLGLFPNPTEGISTLDVNSTVAGMASIEVYSITGALVMKSSKSIRVGANRLTLDLSAVPAGIYMVKAVINGHQALIRTQKK